MRGLTPSLKEVPPWIKCYQTALHAAEQSFVLKKKKSIDKADFIVVLFYEITTATSPFSNHHADQLVAINIKARPAK